MRVIHDDHKGLAQVDALKASGHGSQRRNARFDGFSPEIQRDACGYGREQVVDIVATHEWRANFDLACRRIGDEIESSQRERKFFGCNLGSRSQPIGYGLLCDVAELLAIGVVNIDDAAARRSRAGTLKQASLGGEIILHGVVEIEMIARQIGENGNGKAAAPKTIEGQRVRTAFQNRVRAARPDDFGKETLQIERFGRGGSGRIGFERRAIFDGAEKTAPQTGGADDRIEQKTRGGLAIRSGNSSELQLVGGTPVKV